MITHMLVTVIGTVGGKNKTALINTTQVIETMLMGLPPSSQGERPLDEPNLVPVELVREDNRDIRKV